MLVVLVGIFFGSALLSKVIDWQLKSQLASRVNAKLETASVRYSFPYTVRIDKAHLVVPDTDAGRGWGIDIGRLDLTLAKLPSWSGPLVIQSLDIDKPVVRLSAADETATPPAPAPTPSATATAAASKKLSDLFQLRRVTVGDARVEFDPGTRSQHKPPVVWEHLDANMLTTPTSGGNYQFSFIAKDEPLAVIHADGAFDIDSLLLDMQKLSVSVKVDPSRQAMQLPPIAQQACQKFKIGGLVTFEATAKVPLDDPTHGLYTAKLSLAQGTGEVPGIDKPVTPAQFTMICTNLADETETALSTALPAGMPGDLPKSSPPVHLWLAGLKVCSDKRLVQIERGEIRFDPVTGVWSVQNLKGFVDAGSGPKPIVDVNANGVMDVPAMVLDLQKLSVAVNCDLVPMPAAPAVASADVQKLSIDVGHNRTTALHATTQPASPELNLGGRLTLDAVARVPLRTPMLGLFASRMELSNCSGQIPGVDGKVTPEAVTYCSNLPGADGKSIPAKITAPFPTTAAPVRMWLDNFKVVNGNQIVMIQNGRGWLDPAAMKWRLDAMDALVEAGNSPGPLHDAKVKLHVPFTVTGAGELVSQDSQIGLAESSHFDIKLDKAAVDVTDMDIPLRNIDGVVVVRPHEMESGQLTGTSMGGKLAATLNASWKKMGMAQKLIPMYFGSIDILNMDLHKVAIACTTDESRRAQTTGVMDFSLRFNGMVIPDAPPGSQDSVVNLASGSGDFDIRRGYFKTIPVLRDVLNQFGAYDAATVGEAAGTFTIDKQVITFQQLAASSPAVGVQGTGTVNFDQVADLTFVATPLADWRADIKSSGNSFFDGLADAAGKVQGAINNFQAKTLYQIKVTGPITDPKLDKVILPGVGEKAAGVFDRMSHAVEDNSLIKQLRQ